MKKKSKKHNEVAHFEMDVRRCRTLEASGPPASTSPHWLRGVSVRRPGRFDISARPIPQPHVFL